MPTFSKSHERDENRAMNKAFTRSLTGLLLCWLPVVGLAFAIGGFLRMAVRLTNAHRAKRVLLTMFATLVLIASIGVLGYEVYEYARNPNMIADTVRVVWKGMTGEENPPWEVPQDTVGYNDYSDYGFDPYAEGEDYDPTEDEDYDADFDDSELESFPEDDAEDLPEKDLFNQMMTEQKSGSSSSSSRMP